MTAARAVRCTCATLLSLCALAVPAAGATGWTPPFDLAVTGDVEMTPDGTTVYSGRAALDGAERGVALVRPPGGPVGPLQALGAAGSSSPMIAAGPAGHVAAVWQDSGVLKVASLAPGATTFGPATAVWSNARHVALDVDDAGTVHLLWSAEWTTASGQDNASLHTGTVAADGKLGTSSALILRTPPSGTVVSFYELDLAVGTAGAAIAGWVEDTNNSQFKEIAVALRPAGGSFGARIQIDNSAPPSHGLTRNVVLSGVVMNASGAAAVVWRHTANDGAERTFARVGDATGLGPAQDPAVGAGIFPSLPTAAIDDAGRIHVVWTAVVDGVRRPQRSLYSGGSFTPAETIAMTGDDVHEVSLAVAADGHAVLGVRTRHNGPDRCAYHGSHARPGEAFSAPVLVQTRSPHFCGTANLSIRSGGNGIMAWTHQVTGASPTHEAAALDASAPQLADVAIPSAAAVGSPVQFSAAASDLWGPLRYDWQFGDGSAATGDSVSHTFDAAGDRTVTVTVTDAAGNTAMATGVVGVAVAPETAAAPESQTPPATSIGSSVADLVAPSIAGLGMTRRVFAVAGRPTALAAARKKARRKRGTTFRFSLSEAGGVAIAIHRVLPRRKRTRFVLAGKLQRSGVAGRNRVAFSGRLGKRALKPGRYRATLRATDAARNASRTASVRFRIVKAR